MTHNDHMVWLNVIAWLCVCVCVCVCACVCICVFLCEITGRRASWRAARAENPPLERQRRRGMLERQRRMGMLDETDA